MRQFEKLVERAREAWRVARLRAAVARSSIHGAWREVSAMSGDARDRARANKMAGFLVAGDAASLLRELDKIPLGAKDEAVRDLFETAMMGAALDSSGERSKRAKTLMEAGSLFGALENQPKGPGPQSHVAMESFVEGVASCEKGFIEGLVRLGAVRARRGDPEPLLEHIQARAEAWEIAAAAGGDIKRSPKRSMAL